MPRKLQELLEQQQQIKLSYARLGQTDIYEKLLRSLPEQNLVRLSKEREEIEGGQKSSDAHSASNKPDEMKQLENKMRQLATHIGVELATLPGGRAVWNRLKQDTLRLSKQQREDLPVQLQELLQEQKRIKQKYILMKQTKAYKLLLLSLPEWKSKRIKEASPNTRPGSNKETVRPRKGIEGYYSGPSNSNKRSWWNEED